ncbi:MAG: GHMP kinase [Crenarchaeota archaeon]|nr:GHMP kinase [Thermoproteota archaeon]
MALRISVDHVIESFRREFGREPEVVASAPARLDLLNTHQDYKGLPVVGAAISLRCYVAVARSRTGLVEVVSENFKREGKFHRDVFNPVDPEIIPNWFGTYFRALYVAMSRKLGYYPPPAEILVFSEVPMGSGLGSSAAIEVATALALSRLWGLELGLGDIAEVSYVAEHDVARVPCGRLDQYTSAFGGIAIVRTKPPYGVERLSPVEGVFIAIDSGERHSTAEIHFARQRELEEGLRQLLSMGLPARVRELLSESIYETRWEELREEDLEPYLSRLSDASRKRILYTIRCHRSTAATLRVLKGESIDVEELARALGIDAERARRILESPRRRLEVLAQAMNYQHALLRDLYEVSTPRLEELRGAALRAGALGCKLSGAGLGGTLAAVADSEESASEVSNACLVLGAHMATPVTLDEGARVEWSR